MRALDTSTKWWWAAIAIVTLMFPVATDAQRPAIRISASPTRVQVGEQINVSVESDDPGLAGRLPAPPMTGLQVVGQHTQVTVTNMQMSQTRSYTVIAGQSGTYRIGPIRVSYGGQTLTSNTVNVVVGDGQGTPPQTDPSGASPPNAGDPPTGPLDGAEYDSTAFVRTVVDKKAAYVGEQVTVTIYLYSRVSIAGTSIQREPTAEGCWVHSLIDPNRDPPAAQHSVNGVPFRVDVLRRFAAFPLRAGTVTIGAPAITIPPRQDPFDMFFQGHGGAHEPLNREGVPMSFEVRERPAPGAEVSRDARQRVVTGRFTLEASADRTQVPTGDAIAITVKISGVGNTKSVELATPQIDGLDFLAPEYRDQVEAPSDLVRGERTITWLAVPKRAGTYIIPPFEIAAFDPSTSAYQTLQTQPIRVTAAGNAVGAAPANEPTEPDAEPDTAQLPPLRVASQLERARPPWVRLIRFWVLLIAPAVLWILLLLGTAWQRARERARLAGSPAALVRDARKRFEAAAKSPEDAAAFYAAAAHALVTAIESRIGQSVAGMTYPSMRSLFTAKGMDTDLASRIVDELEGCDFARFSASGTSSKETRECTERVRVLLERLEKLPMVRSKPIAAEATA